MSNRHARRHASPYNLIEKMRMYRGFNSFTAGDRRSAIHEDIQHNMTFTHHYPVDRVDNLGYLMRRAMNNGVVTYREVKQQMKDFGKWVSQMYKDGNYEDVAEALNEDKRWLRDLHLGAWADDLTDRSGSYYHACEDCNRIDHEDNGSWTYDGDAWCCDSCIDDNYRWSESRDTYITVDDWHEENDDEEDEDEDNGVIGQYHSSKRVLGHIPSDYDKFKPRVLMGFELEMEVDRDYDRAEKAQDIYDAISIYTDDKGSRHRYCAFEQDGSIDYGFEMVTGYTGLDVHAKQLEFFKRRMRGVSSHDTRTCGLHVHVCKSDMNLFHAAKLVLFINGSDNQRFLKALARRDGGSRYAQIKNKKADYNWLKQARRGSNSKDSQLRMLNQDRYEALNFQNDNTIEFRLFKGTLKYESIMACLEFSFLSWHFSRDTGVNDLTIPKFLEYICEPENRKHSKFLREYVRSKGFSIPSFAVPKPNPKAVDNIAENERVTAEV